MARPAAGVCPCRWRLPQLRDHKRLVEQSRLVGRGIRFGKLEQQFEVALDIVRFQLRQRCAIAQQNAAGVAPEL